MIIAYNIIATSLNTTQRMLEVNTGNIASAMVTGYKERRVESENNFPFLLSDAMSSVNREGFDEQGRKKRLYEIGTGSAVAGITKNMNQGALETTGREYDLAIVGLGMFQLKRPDGSVAYTRSGVFRRDRTGYMTDVFGNRVEPAIVIPPDTQELQVDLRGRVRVRTTNDPLDTRYIGQLRLAVFDNPEHLKEIGQNMYQQTDEAGTLSALYPYQRHVGMIQQGNLEQSNVNIVQQMMKLVINQRNFKISTKAFLVSDAIMRAGM